MTSFVMILEGDDAHCLINQGYTPVLLIDLAMREPITRDSGGSTLYQTDGAPFMLVGEQNDALTHREAWKMVHGLPPYGNEASAPGDDFPSDWLPY